MQSWGINSAIKLLTYSSELADGKALYVSSNCHPVKALHREPAGHAFHAAALKLRGCAKEATGKNEDTDKKVPKEKDSEYIPSYDSHNNKGKKKSGKQQHDHYALLGLGNLRYLATEDQIRKSYRDAALKHHPDKLAPLLLAEVTEEAKQAKKDEIESHFKLIQEAYEILMDSTKRRIFDSTDEFDDEVPSDCAPKDFFKVFGPAFKRNARWSTNPRVPDLGDENTPLKEVDSFYSWWYSFKSWREFPEEEEHDIEQAESREEKRWMERENTKKSQKARKEEHARIRVLVDNAYKKDIRIVKRKEEEKAMKLQKKEEKIMAKRKLEEEAAAAIEEERRRKEEEAKRAAEAAQLHKRTKEKEKKLLRKERSRLRTLSAPVLSERLLGISVEHVEDLCMSLNTEQLQNLCDRMGNKEGLELAKVIKDGCNTSRNDEAESKEKESKKTNGGTESTTRVSQLDSSTVKKQPWSKEEIDMLRKGMVKYPKGTSRRWEVVSEYIGTGRSVEEILKATKTVLLQKPDSAKAFDSFLEKRKPSASIASPLSTREELGESLPTATTTTKASPSKETVVANSQSSDNNGEAGGSSDTDGWSTVQERALVQALKTFPKETSQRWERVAAAVPGKTMIQCKKKFAELKEIIRNKKTGV
ncbi:PREDICTED: dnaJ homolog subfamily C member 2-like [Camelina sativa]|uniref:DnaJ homolog subfamily C member 2-like n=1 Tax=Camelina sativa TaxID=90675 RepID=A0ABM0XUD4_CAMSA|nr:PREDICTED: dnaJ homolog subfamily C member 2-like [Camelina sativa]